MVQRETLQFLFAVEWALDFLSTTCIDVKIFMAKMPWNFALRDGKALSSQTLGGHICLFMEALEFALVVSSIFELMYERKATLINL